MQIIAAFFTTAALTFLFIILGYLSDSLYEDCLNELDRNITRVTKAWIAWIVHCVRKPSNINPTGKARARKEALVRFILTLSDQQLVTGLAILSGGLGNMYSLTGFEFSIVVSLAWFSSTTHLATLDALQHYFRSHKLVRNIRIFGMVSVLILLSFSYFVSWFSDIFLSRPIQCFFQEGSVSDYFEDPLNVLNFVASILVIWLIWLGYFCRIQASCSEHKAASYWLVLPVWKVWVAWLQHRPKPSCNEIYAEYRAEKRIKSRHRQGRATGPWKWMTMIFLGFEYEESFLSTLPWVAFSFAYGVTQIWQSWHDISSPLPAEASRMGFAQYVSVFLLFLPILAALEAYNGQFLSNSTRS